MAVLVARGVEPEDVFAAISEQAARVCGVGGAAVVRFHAVGAEVVGRWGEVAKDVPAGVEFALGGGGALTLVRETGLPARYDEYASSVGEMGDVVRPAGLRESAAAPVLVEGASGARSGLGRSRRDAAGRRRGAPHRVRRAGRAGVRERRRARAAARVARPARPTADEERKRLERNLHDGAQQRLVSAQLALRMLRKVEERSSIRSSTRSRRRSRSCANSPAASIRRRSRAA